MWSSCCIWLLPNSSAIFIQTNKKFKNKKQKPYLLLCPVCVSAGEMKIGMANLLAFKCSGLQLSSSLGPVAWSVTVKGGNYIPDNCKAPSCLSQDKAVRESPIYGNGGASCQHQRIQEDRWKAGLTEACLWVLDRIPWTLTWLLLASATSTQSSLALVSPGPYIRDM